MADYLKVSAVKKLIKSKDKRCSRDYIEALDQEVATIINRSINNCKAITLKTLTQE